MKRVSFLLCLLSVSISARSQTVSLGEVSRTLICWGDTIWVHYTSNGVFEPDNFFAVQLSDEKGSFTTFTNIGHATAASDSIPVALREEGEHIRVRMISTSPFSHSATTSQDIRTVLHPQPRAAPNGSPYGAEGFVGEPIKFRDAFNETPGSTYFWTFDSAGMSGANIQTANTDSALVVYSTEGIKTGTLTVTNIAGCSVSSRFLIRILTCDPVIPSSAHIVTGDDAGNYPYVWVKAGGNFGLTRGNGSSKSTVFAEPGSSINATSGSIGTYYLKSGVSFSANGGYGLVVLDKGSSIPRNSGVDTLLCNSLTFHLESADVDGEPNAEEPLHVWNSNQGLRAKCMSAAICITVFDPLGKSIVTKSSNDELVLDYSTLPNGVYFATIVSDHHRQIRTISVGH
jgi:PKD repeat protein